MPKEYVVLLTPVLILKNFSIKERYVWGTCEQTAVRGKDVVRHRASPTDPTDLFLAEPQNCAGIYICMLLTRHAESY
jgi:hypothetical protein